MSKAKSLGEQLKDMTEDLERAREEAASWKSAYERSNERLRRAEQQRDLLIDALVVFKIPGLTRLRNWRVEWLGF